MQTFNSFNELASSMQPCQSAMSVFNDQARINKIRHLFERAKNENEAKELLKLIDEETQYWVGQDKNTLTETQRKEALEYLRLIEQMDKMLPNANPTIRDCFTEFPQGKPQD